MRVYYFRDSRGNFGDHLNTWLWPRILPGVLDENTDILMSGIGTIISEDMPAAKKWIVFSSGAGYRPPPASFGGRGWHVISVRGPLTAQVLGLSDDTAVTDGAILLTLLPEYTPAPESERKGIVFMPSHEALDTGNWPTVCARAGIEFIDARADSRETLLRLRRAKLVLAEAMHGAIAADCLRVPWVPILSHPEINGFKWLDWTLSMGLEYRPYVLPASTLSDSVRSWVLRCTGAAQPSGESPESAVCDYEKMCSRNRSAWWVAWRKIRRAVASRAGRAAGLLAKTAWGRAEFDARIERAADALREARRQTPFLSDDHIFMARREQMMDRLEAVKKLVLRLQGHNDVNAIGSEGPL